MKIIRVFNHNNTQIYMKNYWTRAVRECISNIFLF